MTTILGLKKFSVMEILGVAREIVSTLIALHEKKVMHLNLTCEHIILDDLDSNAVKIISCGSSTNFTSKENYMSNQDLKRNLLYLSPEQTCRINQDVDFRSDFFSLGVIFYKMITKKYPFENKNLLKLVYSHIIKSPIPVHVQDPSIPVPISDMIMKLMKKNAEDRYQSAKGIIHDIDLMISDHKTDEMLRSVILAQRDTPETLLAQHKLYGRSKERDSLFSLYDRLPTSLFELVFVSGVPGTGEKIVS